MRAALSWSKPKSVLADVLGIIKIFMDDHVHHAERKRHVSSRIDGQIPVGGFGGACLVRINHHQLGAFTPRLFNKRPEMNVVAVNVGAPGNDVL